MVYELEGQINVLTLMDGLPTEVIYLIVISWCEQADRASNKSECRQINSQIRINSSGSLLELHQNFRSAGGEANQ